MRQKTSWGVALLWGLLLLALSACEHGEEEAGPAPGPGNQVLAFLQKPFQGTYRHTNPFDHDLPLLSRRDDNDFMLTWRGERITPGWDGHNGHDWRLPEGTPVLAAAAGEVVFADWQPPTPCGRRGEVSALVIRIQHLAPHGEQFETLYGHLSRIDVAAGQVVQAGAHLGLSGNTGCSSGPHLHFGVFRLTNTNSGAPTPIDPFGWEGAGQDPWAQHPEGAHSLWLWQEGRAPDGDFGQH